ncbi:MAG TPA: hypothetical protein VED22_05345 [Nitrososphaerales archaeon]|nr:hypothetical protein [Nitrososphaerales archaeon]
MKRSVSLALLLMLVLVMLSAQLPAHSQAGTTSTGARVSVRSVYTLDRYGFATVNESVEFTNNQTSAVPIPALTFGLGNLSSDVEAYNLTGSGFSLATPASAGGPYTVSSTESVQAGGNASFVLRTLLGGVVTKLSNGTISVLTLSSPSIGSKVDSLLNVVQMPTSTSFKTAPQGLTASLVGTNNTYSSSASEITPGAVTSVSYIQASSAQDFNPLRIFDAVRSISADSHGNPVVTDTIEFQNLGTTPLSTLYIQPLASGSATATVETLTEPKLLSPVSVSLISDSIDLTQLALGYPNNGVAAGGNFTITYQYPLGSHYYSVSGGRVTLDIPETPPISAFINSFTIELSLPHGATSTSSAPTTLTGVTPWQTGQTSYSYGLSVGWAIDDGVPFATIVFSLLLIGLFASRTTTAEAEEEEEEESSTELASAMIKAFEEKTNLINSLWPEIESKDPNDLDREYFDELRTRLDTFRSRALQRLNEVKQKSTSQKFYEVVNQIHQTEREVDRAAKDKLNLYQQYYTRQMRKEVFDRLLPQYTKRLEKALNQLSDELHTVQREAKLL